MNVFVILAVTLEHSKANMGRSANMVFSCFRHSIQELHHNTTKRHSGFNIVEICTG
jgi:hypothetical protein